MWIDERGRIARPAEVAFADNRFIAYTKFDMTRYLDAIRDWVAKGSASGHVRPPAGRRERLSLPTAAHAQAAACFRLAEYLHAQGHAEAAMPFFKEAQRLEPESWCYKRQAWALTDAERFYSTSFQDEVKALGGRPQPSLSRLSPEVSPDAPEKRAEP